MVSGDELRFEVDFHIAEAELTINYRVRNAGQRTAYLLNRLWKNMPGFTLNPNIIYVALDAATRTVRFSKKLADLPVGKTVTAPVAPFVTPLRPGETFDERVRVSLPVEEYLQYANPRRGLQPVRYEAVDFCIGFYWGVPSVTEEVRSLGGNTVVIPTFPAGTRPVFGELCSRPKVMAVPVLEPVR